MATIHEDPLNVSAGGYADLAAASANDTITTIYASQVIESSQRRFITDSERYSIANLQLNGMLKSSYDADGDGMVDTAYKALTATNATTADSAGTAVQAVRASTADRATEADHAVKAERATNADSSARSDVADRSLEADHALLADNANRAAEATHAVSANSAATANRATEADHALEADKAGSADSATFAETARNAYSADTATVANSAQSVSWDNVSNKPDVVVTSQLTWNNIKNTAPSVLSDTDTLDSRIDDLENASHEHHNMSTLNKITADSNDLPLWNGLKWPAGEGDMKMSTYDIDGDGIVDQAKTVNWEFITNLPTKFTPEDHTHMADQIIQNSSHKFVSDAQIASWDAKQDALGYTAEDASKKGRANGYASLDADGKLSENEMRNPYWEQIDNRPNSMVEDIDDAVARKHSHVNSDALEKLTQNSEGKPIWNGSAWPYTGDMHKSVYDMDNDGIVDRSKIADSVAWSTITSKPSSTVAEIDETVSKKHTHTNIAALELLTKDSLNAPLWNGKAWPFDMSKAVYDTDSDGVVDEAAMARAVKWTGVMGRPVSEVTLIDDAVGKAHRHINNSVLENINNSPSAERLTFKGKDIAFVEDVASIGTPNGDIQAKHSVAVDPEDSKLHLVNDVAYPNANSYYGTDNNGTRGFYALPGQSSYTASNSIALEGSIFMLKNDNPAPESGSYYGTDEDGVLGYHHLPDNTITSIEAFKVVQDATHRFVTNEQLEKINAFTTPSSGGASGGTSTDADTITGPEALGGTRECILSAMDGFFNINGSDLIIKASESDPIIASFSNGRQNEIIKKIKSNMTISNIPSVMDSGIIYIYLYIDSDGSVKADKTSVKPVFSNSMPSDKTKGKYWFNINTYTMYISTGSTFIVSDKPVLFIGEISAASGRVSKTVYAFNGMYDSGWYTVAYGTSYNKSHNLGTDIVSISAYRGMDGVNMGEFAFALHGSSLTEAIAVGDRVSKITENNIQTTRYNMVQYSSESEVYGGTNQHRVIVRRGW